MVSLKQLLKQTILETVVKPIKPESGFCIMVVDAATLRILSAACRMYDITDNGVTLVEDIKKKRQPLPQFDVIYFVEPTEENARLIREDFAQKSKYAKAHLFFVDGTSMDAQLSLIFFRLRCFTCCLAALFNFTAVEYL